MYSICNQFVIIMLCCWSHKINWLLSWLCIMCLSRDFWQWVVKVSWRRAIMTPYHMSITWLVTFVVMCCQSFIMIWVSISLVYHMTCDIFYDVSLCIFISNVYHIVYDMSINSFMMLQELCPNNIIITCVHMCIYYYITHCVI